MTTRTLSMRAWAELCFLALLWGGSFFSIEIALREIGFLTVVAHRVVWAALALGLILLLRGTSFAPLRTRWRALLVMGLLNNIIPFSMMAWGQTQIESGLTSIFNAATALFGVIVAAIVLSDERMTWRKGLGTVIGFSGVLIAIGPEALRDFDLRSLAQIAVLGGALSYAFASVWARLHLGDLPPALAAFGMLSASSLMILPLTFAMEGVPTLALEWSTWAAIGYYALGATALAYLVFYRVLAMAGAANLMLVTLLLTPIAIALGVIFLDEAIGAGALLGCAVLGFGLVVLDGRLFKLLHRRAIAR